MQEKLKKGIVIGPFNPQRLNVTKDNDAEEPVNLKPVTLKPNSDLAEIANSMNNSNRVKYDTSDLGFA